MVVTKQISINNQSNKELTVIIDPPCNEYTFLPDEIILITTTTQNSQSDGTDIVFRVQDNNVINIDVNINSIIEIKLPNNVTESIWGDNEQMN